MIKGMNDAEMDESMGRQVKDLREAQGMSRDDLVDAMVKRGFSTWTRKTVWSVETGRRSLKFTEGRAIEGILGVNFAESVPTDTPRWNQLLRAVNAYATQYSEYAARLQEDVTGIADCAETACQALHEAYLGVATTDGETKEGWGRIIAPAQYLGDACEEMLRGQPWGSRNSENYLKNPTLGKRIIDFLHDYPLVCDLGTMAAQRVLADGGDEYAARDAVDAARVSGDWDGDVYVGNGDGKRLIPFEKLQEWQEKQRKATDMPTAPTAASDEAAAPVDGDAAKDAAQ